MTANYGDGTTALPWRLLIGVAACVTVLFALGASLLLLWSAFATSPPDEASLAARIQQREGFRSVTLADCTEGAYLGQAADADGTVYDLSVTVEPGGVVNYSGESRERDASRQRLEKTPEKHMGLREVVFIEKGDGQFAGTGNSQDGIRCEFTLKRQVVAPYKGGVGYDFRVIRPDGEVRSGAIHMNIDRKKRSGSFHW